MVKKELLPVNNEITILQKKILTKKDKIIELNNKKDDLIKKIETYQHKYHLEFKDILSKILYLRQQHTRNTFVRMYSQYKDLSVEYSDYKKQFNKLKEQLQNCKSTHSCEEIKNELSLLIEILYRIKEDFFEIDLKKKKEEWNNSKKEYQNLNDIFNDNNVDTQSYTKDEILELKKTYKKAARLCHPDIVKESLKQDAQELFQELHQAYKEKNITLIQELIKFLSNGDIFSIEEYANDKNILEKDLEKLLFKERKLIDEINFILSDDEFSFVFSINEQTHFNHIREQLNSVLHELLVLEEKPSLDKEQWIKKFVLFANKFKIDTQILPRNIKYIKEIHTLDLSSFQLTYLTATIENLELLTTLNLSSNNLSVLPLELGNLKNLKELNINYNNFKEIPEVVFNIESLEVLKISNNFIKNISADILKLKNLVYLDIGTNLIDILPDSLYQLKRLKHIIAWCNLITHISNKILNFKLIKELNLSGNKIKYLPNEIMQLKTLCIFDVSYNENLSLTQVQKTWMQKFDSSLLGDLFK